MLQKFAFNEVFELRKVPVQYLIENEVIYSKVLGINQKGLERIEYVLIWRRMSSMECFTEMAAVNLITRSNSGLSLTKCSYRGLRRAEEGLDVQYIILFGVLLTFLFLFQIGNVKEHKYKNPSAYHKNLKTINTYFGK